MKSTIAKRLFAIALAVCAATLLSPTMVSAGDRVEVDQSNFGPLTTRALFPGVNLGGPGVKESDWYPVYLVRNRNEAGIDQGHCPLRRGILE